MQKFIWFFLVVIYFSSNLIAKDIDTFLKDVKNKAFETASKASISIDGNEHSFSYMSREIKVIPTIYLMYSESVPLEVIKNYAIYVKRLKAHFPDIRAYIVFKGFKEKLFWMKIRNEIYSEDLAGTISFKVHPKIYDYYHLDSVPAFIFSKCQENYSFKKCDNKNSYVVKGDISLPEFFDILSDDNDYFKKYQSIFREE